jgi:uncharacterized protein (DUF1800 family)
MLTVLAQLGQVPFLPPNVGGWQGNEVWLSTNASLARLTYARYITEKGDLSFLDRGGKVSPAAAAADALGVPKWTARTSAALAAATTPAELMTLALVAPESLLN